MQNWHPSWSEDETICARNVNNEVPFFDNNDFNVIANKLNLQTIILCYHLDLNYTRWLSMSWGFGICTIYRVMPAKCDSAFKLGLVVLRQTATALLYLAQLEYTFKCRNMTGFLAAIFGWNIYRKDNNLPSSSK
ncbi:hypothetical protein EI555_000832 [Monodon monoceros]|uniref:Uncharacterized protein n=1 Tax=Monodon monoceros TaxID=40151 RepID=A0A4U1ERF0_MONMO|nr:hypothetical protein EI555_000832 [Monodon monoceros]